eukprot:CAMPEP_0182925442 /NCGR_PEP_ID=MMETSP0105_2-20130417/9414_1 /TAXON_ID=81532 ORGANISM="Acanthoeca-like sp., Strain 10tr" /NCGR_SAMPLE_ID=MMETSP0105_2 /ASSEMBLY_ACC=CAM_ASM_000205 /LENGTH=427 /DNA_ID=CAMNT_0025063291 /DNA_START=41 /DNA_END=1321 /DNA_ORIENTATION=-
MRSVGLIAAMAVGTAAKSMHGGPTPPPGPLPVVPPLTPPACGSGETAVKVFVLMGQSNMLGEGKKTGTGNSLENAVTNQSQYPYLWDKATGNWSVSKNVRNVFVMGSGGVNSGITLFNNEFMTAATDTPTGPAGMSPKAKDTIGPELGIGFALGNYTTDPIMTLKTCIGNRALGWDLMPPGTPRRSFTDSKGQKWEYCGYHDSPEKWNASAPPPPPASASAWYAGLQYDGDTQRAYDVLGNLSTFYPGAKCYEVAGFFWWQGDRDSYDEGLSTNYEANLVQLIKQLRIQYGSPKAKFVTASLGQTAQNSTGNGHLILQAMENVADDSKYPEFAGNVAAVYTHPLLHSRGASNSHYGGDAFTYMNIGQAMGQAMVKLLQGTIRERASVRPGSTGWNQHDASRFVAQQSFSESVHAASRPSFQYIGRNA